MSLATAEAIRARTVDAWCASVAVLGAGAVAWAVLSLGGPFAALHPLGHSVPVPGALALAAVVWLLMIVAMMLPATLPWVIAFVGLAHGPRRARRTGIVLLLGGYVTVWGAFAACAAALQVALHENGLLLGPGSRVTGRLAGAVLVGTGWYQLSELKRACLNRCRSPVSFFLSSWRDGPAGAFRMGLGHGTYCLACCWALMAAAFALGVMNLAWMAALTAVMASEKLLPGGAELGRAAGAAAVLGGAWMLWAA